MAQEISVLV